MTAVDQTLLRRCSSTCAQHTSARWGLAVFQVRRIREQPIITSAQSMGGGGVALARVTDMTGSRHRAVFHFMAGRRRSYISRLADKNTTIDCISKTTPDCEQCLKFARVGGSSHGIRCK